MKMDLEDGYSITTISPASASDKISITIAKDNRSQGMVCLDANQSAAFISELRKAFLQFTE
jgi:hypothetical protein